MTKKAEPQGPDDNDAALDRRTFLTRSSNLAMATGLAGGYGALGLVAGRYMYPARQRELQWLFVSETDALKEGDSLLYRGPAGETINITRQGSGTTPDDFIALSSTCPHLGCQVHWEGANNRYFCPCHNGTFDPEGVGTGGPPGDAGQSLPRYALRVENALLFIEVPADDQALGNDDVGEVIERRAGISGPGHDPCLDSHGRARRS